MRRTALLSMLLVLVLAGTSWAFDYDDLFGEDLLVELEVTEGALPPEEALLVRDRLEAGGSYDFGFLLSRPFLEGAWGETSVSAELNTQVFLDARPDPNFRAFAKAGISYALSEPLTPPRDRHLQAELQELFVDFNAKNQVFFRAGKQNVPASISTIRAFDALDEEGERQGVLALKVHYPQGSSNYYLYALADQGQLTEGIALAPRMEFVVGKTEFSLGGYYHQQELPRLLASVSSSFGKVGFFGEAMLVWGSERGFLEPRGPVYEIVEKDGPFLRATAGGMYSYKDSGGRLDLSGILQYYFNGEGYEDQEAIKKVRLAMLNQELPPVLNWDKLGKVTLTGSGRHYLAGSLSWNRLLGSKFSASVFVLTNLSDSSGLISGTLRLPAWGKLSPSVGLSTNFGAPGTEFGGRGRAAAVTASLSISGAF